MANNVYSNYAMNVRLGNYQVINAVQGEVNTRWITVTFMNDNMPYDLTGLFTTINMIKSDNTVIFNDGTIVDATNGVAKFLVTSQMCAIDGTYDVFFKIYGNTPTSELKITGFKLVVEPANNDAGIISSNEFNALQTLIGQVQPAIAEVNTAITNCNTAANNANDKATFAQTEADYAKKEGDYAKNVPYVGTDGYWYAWNSTTEKYEKTTAYASVNYATFELNPVDGHLYMDTADNYTGATFTITSNGYLQAVI